MWCCHLNLKFQCILFFQPFWLIWYYILSLRQTGLILKRTATVFKAKRRTGFLRPVDILRPTYWLNGKLSRWPIWWARVNFYWFLKLTFFLNMSQLSSHQFQFFDSNSFRYKSQGSSFYAQQQWSVTSSHLFFQWNVCRCYNLTNFDLIVGIYSDYPSFADWVLSIWHIYSCGEEIDNFDPDNNQFQSI